MQRPFSGPRPTAASHVVPPADADVLRTIADAHESDERFVFRHITSARVRRLAAQLDAADLAHESDVAATPDAESARAVIDTLKGELADAHRVIHRLAEELEATRELAADLAFVFVLDATVGDDDPFTVDAELGADLLLLASVMVGVPA